MGLTCGPTSASALLNLCRLSLPLWACFPPSCLPPSHKEDLESREGSF